MFFSVVGAFLVFRFVLFFFVSSVCHRLLAHKQTRLVVQAGGTGLYKDILYVDSQYKSSLNFSGYEWFSFLMTTCLCCVRSPHINTWPSHEIYIIVYHKTHRMRFFFASVRSSFFSSNDAMVNATFCSGYE